MLNLLKIENHIANSTCYKERMNSYCLSRKTNTKNTNQKMVKTTTSNLFHKDLVCSIV